MKPNRFEWLDQERERIAREGVGASYVEYVYVQHLKRSGGIILAMLPIISILYALRQTTGGPVQPRALLISGIILTAFSIATLRKLKRGGLLLIWAPWTTLGMS